MIKNNKYLLKNLLKRYSRLKKERSKRSYSGNSLLYRPLGVSFQFLIKIFKGKKQLFGSLEQRLFKKVNKNK